MVVSGARKLVRATPVIMPAGVIIANILDIAMTATDPASAVKEFIKRISSVDIDGGGIDLPAFMKGGGAVILTTIFGKVLKELSK